MSRHNNSIPIFVSSDPTHGAALLTKNGSKFDVNFRMPLSIPRDAFDITIEVADANIWYNFPNIETGISDTITLTFSGTTYDIVFEKGLYDIASLNDSLTRQLINFGLKSNLLQIGGTPATGKAYLVATEIGIDIDLTAVRNMALFLGFEEVVLPTTTLALTVFNAPNIARLNNISSILVHTDLVGSGLLTSQNSYSNNMIANIPIDASVGAEINYRPSFPVHVVSDQLVGTNNTSCSFWITDQNNQSLDTNGEYWSLTLIVRYTK